jgi:hypothetical protein
VRVKTRVYFAVHSDVLSPEELEARIGVPPSSVTRKAARHADPARPPVNAWKIDSPLSPSAPLWQHLQASRKVIAEVLGLTPVSYSEGTTTSDTPGSTGVGPRGDLMELNGWASPQMLLRYGASAPLPVKPVETSGGLIYPCGLL